MTAKTMAEAVEALAKWMFENEWGGDWADCHESAKPGWIRSAQETLDFLSAAGFGLVADAKAPEESCQTRLMDGRNEIRCWLPAGHEGDHR